MMWLYRLYSTGKLFVHQRSLDAYLVTFIIQKCELCAPGCLFYNSEVCFSGMSLVAKRMSGVFFNEIPRKKKRSAHRTINSVNIMDR
jgi:hypothetical protein